MPGKGYQLNKSVIYREAGDETIVIQVDAGHFFYYSKATKEFLDLFKSPQTLDSVSKAVNTSSKALGSVLDTLMEQEILTKVSVATEPKAASKASLSVPQFLRQGEKSLDEIAFLS